MRCMITANRRARGHDRLLHPAAPGDLHRPSLEPGPFLQAQHSVDRLIEHDPHHLDAASRYPATTIDLARYLAQVNPKTAPTDLDLRKRAGTSTVAR